jgi:hypothetical protein
MRSSGAKRFLLFFRGRAFDQGIINLHFDTSKGGFFFHDDGYPDLAKIRLMDWTFVGIGIFLLMDIDASDKECRKVLSEKRTILIGIIAGSKSSLQDMTFEIIEGWTSSLTVQNFYLIDLLTLGIQKEVWRCPKDKVKFFFVPYSEIKENGYELSISKYLDIEYEEVEYEKPEVILNKIEALEDQIKANKAELRRMPAENN